MLKEELEMKILLLLQSNSSTTNSDELGQLIQLYRELNKSNYKNITFTDLLPSVSIICITSIIITFLVKLL